MHLSENACVQSGQVVFKTVEDSEALVHHKHPGCEAVMVCKRMCACFTSVQVKCTL